MVLWHRRVAAAFDGPAAGTWLPAQHKTDHRGGHCSSPPSPSPLQGFEEQRGKTKEGFFTKLFPFSIALFSGYEAEIFPLGFAPAYSRRLSFYHKWVRLRSPTPYPGPWHVKSGGFCMGCPSLGTVLWCFPSQSVFCTGLAWFWCLQSSTYPEHIPSPCLHPSLARCPCNTQRRQEQCCLLLLFICSVTFMLRHKGQGGISIFKDTGGTPGTCH